MNSQEAITLLRNLEDALDSYCELNEEEKTAFRMAITALEQSGCNYSESPNGWIPCSERLPEEDGDYFVTFEEGYAEDYGFDLIGVAPYEVDCEGFGIWQEKFDLHTLGSLGSEWVDINVIAWMPLLSPYKPEEKRL